MGITERREREKQRRRDTILASARDLFSAHGYEGTKMTDIADRCELSKGTLYLYFSSKEDLAHAIIEDHYRALLERLAADVGRAETGRERLEAIVTSFLAYFRANAEQIQMVFALEGKVLASPDAARAWDNYVAYTVQARRLLVDAIERGRRDGSIGVDGDPDLLAATFITAAFGYLQRMFGYSDLIEFLGYDRDELIRTFLLLLLRSVR